MSRLARMIAIAMVSVTAADVAFAANVAGTTYQTISVDGVDRTFIVHVGTNAPANAPAAVVFVIHGTSGDGQRFYDDSGWREKADLEGFIAIFPDALRHCFYEDENGDGDYNDTGELKLTTKWAAGQLGEGAAMPPCADDIIARLPTRARPAVDHPVADDLGFFDAMVEFARANLIVNDHRIYATGFSNGAQMATRLAVERSDVFAAVAAHAGNLTVPVVPARPVPFVMSFGSRDNRVAAATGMPELPLSEDVLRIFNELISNMRTQFSLTEAYDFTQPVVRGKILASALFDQSTVSADSPFYFIVIEDNTHSYPNGRNHPVPIATLLWEFFEAHPLP